MKILIASAQRALRVFLLLVVVAILALVLVRLAPGFFADEREVNARYSQSASAQLHNEQAVEGSLALTMVHQLRTWTRGDLGESRQYRIPVLELVAPRLRTSLLLLAQGVGYGWLIAVCAAFPLSRLRQGSALGVLPFTFLLSTPTAALATACIVCGWGGPLLVLSLITAARDFKFLLRMLRKSWTAPHLLHGRSQGMGLAALTRVHLLPNVAHAMGALATLSIVTALSALIPIEVIFNVSGIGQLAWSAVMNRDLPVIVTVTMIMASVVAASSMLSQNGASPENA